MCAWVGHYESTIVKSLPHQSISRVCWHLCTVWIFTLCKECKN